MKFAQRLLICSLAALSVTRSGHSQSADRGLQVSPATIDFGETPVNTDGPAREVVVSNPTNTAFSLQQILTSGIDFSEKSNCGQTLSPGAQCTIQVLFTPAISGPRTGSVVVLGSDGSPHFVALSGIGKE